MTYLLNDRTHALARAWQVISDLVLAIAVVWALPLSLAIAAGVLKLLWNAL